MTNLLIMLTLPEKVGNKYYSHLKAKFPEININMVDHHSKVGPYIGSADIFGGFGAQMSDHVLKEGTKLKWVQELGTGVDGITDQPALGENVMVTNMHGLHGDSMSDSAFLSMLALARDLPRVLRNQSRHTWERFPSRLLK